MKFGSIDLDVYSIIRYDVCRLIITIIDTEKGMPLDKINELLECSGNVSDEDLNQINDLKADLKIVKKIIYILSGTLIIKSEENIGTLYGRLSIL